jgi:hypothetical protein
VHVAVDIDSTLHHYWDILSQAARRRFGVELPYDAQLTWGITRLRPEQLAACVADTHTEARILAAEPYPGAVESVRRWHDAGHQILVVSHRTVAAHPATVQWLERIGLPFDALHCSNDKIAHCVQAGVELLIDDSPVNLKRAIERDMRVATLLHPWNSEVCEEEGILCASDWPQLAAKLEPLLNVAAGPTPSPGEVGGGVVDSRER